ncbi:unnamed protein product [Brassica rapa subsp. trilocularis]
MESSVSSKLDMSIRALLGDHCVSLQHVLSLDIWVQNF